MSFNAKIGLLVKKIWGAPQKKIDFWAPKNKRLIFSKAGNSQICWTIGGGQDNATVVSLCLLNYKKYFLNLFWI